MLEESAAARAADYKSQGEPDSPRYTDSLGSAYVNSDAVDILHKVFQRYLAYS
jgi:hypothetical protein